MMDRQEFDSASRNMGDQAFASATLFELLSAAYNAIACGRYDEYREALIKLNQRPKDDLITVLIRDAHETLCDRGWSNELSQVSSEIYEALSPFND